MRVYFRNFLWVGIRSWATPLRPTDYMNTYQNKRPLQLNARSTSFLLGVQILLGDPAYGADTYDKRPLQLNARDYFKTSYRDEPTTY
jgi:hypothetical protein